MDFVEVQVDILLVTMIIFGILFMLLVTRVEKLELKLKNLIASRGKVRRPTRTNPRELFTAVYDNDVNKLAFLIKVKGLHPESRDPDEYDWTPLMIASRKGYIEIVKFLCAECHVNVNAKDSDGWTALHLAANRNNIDVIKYLIEEQHADTTLTNEGGCTILHVAAYTGYLELVQYICESTSVDIDLTNKDGQTAADIALDQGFKQIYDYIFDKLDQPTYNH